MNDIMSKANIRIDYEDRIDHIRIIRHALLIGLDSYGEIERIINAVDIRGLYGKEVADDLKPKSPTAGDPGEAIGDFAWALLLLELMEREASEMHNQ